MGLLEISGTVKQLYMVIYTHTIKPPPPTTRYRAQTSDFLSEWPFASLTCSLTHDQQLTFIKSVAGIKAFFLIKSHTWTFLQRNTWKSKCNRSLSVSTLVLTQYFGLHRFVLHLACSPVDTRANAASQSLVVQFKPCS